ncbi:hypothetical protein AAX26_01556 [Aliarcobacter thereius]|uniref:HIT family protein n=2 Tax=Aliarcobacter thereius TaxID=544718 RepID=A0A1C0B6B2_9BACT|nr:HIT family protein [Aliarcobacter thereius]OCL86423.1 hypothetical protein AAX26_01556 [Aliarcobacter thereius]OCL90108.1 hypothetical protein AAX25_01862 [Aliarcobacter thereius]OCL96292.1 hypothetical protein AA347_01783 [Aliarcobacter thereius LMG 24486]OCL98848.1 hypothetical protein AAX29_01358 [Aliarcobacter thereius]QBF15745.1 HIT family protein [Aliarcobacter thereius LMG 24486]
MQIYKNSLVNIQIENSEVPWLKIFVNREVKEFSDCTFEEKLEIFKILEIIEKLMINYFNCEKINIASFGNYVAQVHFHIMARFKEDSYFPESMWGVKQREAKLSLPSFEEFYELLRKSL